MDAHGLPPDGEHHLLRLGALLAGREAGDDGAPLQLANHLLQLGQEAVLEPGHAGCV